MLLRVFESEPGGPGQLLPRLQEAAARMIQRRRVDAVQLCRYADHPGRILWIQDRRPGAERGPALLRDAASPELSSGAAGRAFELIDSFYRYPLPRCQVWSLDVALPWRPEGNAIARLLDASCAAARRETVAGLSVYRALDPPPAALVFVALEPGPPPRALVPLPAGLAGHWSPLIVVWTMGRLTLAPDRRERRAQPLYPRAAFWTRDMPVVPVEALREEA